MTIEELEIIWTHVREDVEPQMTKPSYETWLKPTRPWKLEDNILFIEVPNEFARDLLESRYAPLIISTLKNYIPEELGLKFIILKNDSSGEHHLSAPHVNFGAEIYMRSG